MSNSAGSRVCLPLLAAPLLFPFLAPSSPGAGEIGPSPIVVERSTPGEVMFTYRMSEPVALELVEEKEGTFTRVLIPGAVSPLAAGVPDLPVVVVRVGVPPEGSLTVAAEALEEERHLLSAPLRRVTADPPSPRVLEEPPAPGGEETLARIGAVGEFRGLRIVSVLLTPARLDEERGELRVARSMRVAVRVSGGERRLSSPGAPGEAPDDPFLPDVVVNYPTARSWRGRPTAVRPAAEGDYFDFSENWCRIEVNETGLHEITYGDLAQAGVDPPEHVIPVSLRLFSGGGLALPESLGVIPPEWMEECAIQVYAADDSSLTPADRIVFYALGTSGWEGEYDPSGDWDEHFEHPYSPVNVYWLTWEESVSPAPGFADSVRRITPREAPGEMGEAAYVDPDTAFYERRHYEHNLIENFRTPAGDGWYWTSFRQLGRIKSFPVAHPDAVPARPSRVRVSLLGYAEPLDANLTYHFAGVAVDDPSFTERLVGAHEWVDETATFFDSTGTWLAAGTESSLVWVAVADSQRSAQPPQTYDRYVYLDWIELMYWRRLRARQNELYFTAPTDSAGLAAYGGIVEYPIVGFTDTTGLRVLDITDPHRLESVTSWEVSGSPGAWTLTVRDSLPSAGPRRYLAATEEHLLRPESISLYRFPYGLEGESLLRRHTGGVDYCIVTHSSLLPAARSLAAHRAREMRVRVVTTESVMDEFGWGLMDPTALRNFARFAYTNWRDGPGDPGLSYLLLMGDASKDFLDRNSSDDPNLVPSYEGRYLLPRVPGAQETDYATDDWFAYTEPGDVFADFAVGRLPVRTPAEAQLMAEVIEDYEADPDWGTWRNRIILGADDELRPSGGRPEFVHTRDSETLAVYYLPPALDQEKIYLMEYPMRGGRKPDAAEALKKVFDEGALLFNYIGHGDETRLADEFLLEWDGTWAPANENRRPVMVIFSCSVGKFDMPRSGLVEILLLQEEGGLVGSFSSTFLAFPPQNAVLSRFFYTTLFETRPAKRLGEAARLAKMDFLSLDPEEYTYMERYAVLGDPALKIAWPPYEIRFGPLTSQELLRRERAFVRGGVYTAASPAGSLATWLSGEAELTVRASSDTTGHDYGGDENLHYEIAGPPVFRGYLSAVDGEFGHQVYPGEGEFFVAADAPRGPRGRIGCYVYDPITGYDASGSLERLPVAGEAVGGGDDTQGPSVTLLGPGGEPLAPGALVRRSSPLTAVFSDDHGINATGLDPYYALGYRLDEGSWVDLTDGFRIDRGGFTTGRVTFAFPDTLRLGEHVLALRAADNFNNRREKEIRLTITTGQELSLSGVFPYPNPFRESTVIVYELTQPAQVTVRIYTGAGRLIRLLGEEGQPGENTTLVWDGRDETGDPVANGVYFVKIEARDSEGEGRTLRALSRLVRMR